MTGPVLAFAAVILYAALHSALASPWAKAATRRAFGEAADRWYRLAYNVIGVVTLLPVLAVPALEPGRTLYAVPLPWSAFMVAGQLAAAGVVALGLLQTDVWHFLGLRQLVETGKGGPSRFVATGLYSYVRHPLYTAGLVFLWLTPVLTTTLMALFAGLSLYLYVGSVFEERRLLAEFGQPYAEYQRLVPRLIPRLRRPAPP
ncbi:MAG TPA: isoprenylcysteine carboxylmethyltransferase family protein [Anaerolineales bacterium]|nr:isoprenylcysteine carboxylmethyltransferase family protein [Anaerolineales bacterium]